MGAKASGRSSRHHRGYDVLIDASFSVAFLDALDKFVSEHGREPNWDEVNIRGGSTTLEVIVEIEEVGIDG